MVPLLYLDDAVAVCVKPPRVLSTDEPGGLPDLVRAALWDPKADVRTVHRLDRVVGGVMVVARSAAAASELSRQIREGRFEKKYLAVVHGAPAEERGTLRDMLGRDKARKMTYVASGPGKDIREAILHYRVISCREGLSLVEVELETGRTHQIRVQFASRGMPLVGERKYSTLEDGCELALWSREIGFCHPVLGKRMTFSHWPPKASPWTLFRDCLEAFPEGEELSSFTDLEKEEYL